MTKSEFYYLVMVCGAFTVFGVSMAIGYVRYRRWLKHPPTAAE